MPRAAASKIQFSDEPLDEILDQALASTGRRPGDAGNIEAASPKNPPNPPPLNPDRRKSDEPRYPDPSPDPTIPEPVDPRPAPVDPDPASESEPGDPPDGPHRHGDEVHEHERDEPGHTHPEHDDQPAEPVEETEDDEDDEDTRSSELPADPPHTALSPPLDGELLPRHARYESRITIVDAWKYPGSLRDAPAWVDRNWAAYSDFDPLRMIEPGPCLRVPLLGGNVAVARIGDYVATQEIKIHPELPGELRLEVWNSDQFERLFIPA